MARRIRSVAERVEALEGQYIGFVVETEVGLGERRIGLAVAKGEHPAEGHSSAALAVEVGLLEGHMSGIAVVAGLRELRKTAADEDTRPWNPGRRWRHCRWLA